MADRTRVQLIADLSEAQHRSNGRIHATARAILNAAPPSVRRATVPERVAYVMGKLVPWLMPGEAALLDVDERGRLRGAHDHTRDVVTARLWADERATTRPPMTLTRTAPPGQVRR